MTLLRNYKILTYILLTLVVIISFLITNLLLNLVISEKLSGYTIIYIILNLILNFSMFFIVFRLVQIIVEKDIALKELVNHIQSTKEENESSETHAEVKEFNADDIIQQIIPASPQNLKINEFTEKILANISKVTELVQGVMYVKNKETGMFSVSGRYAYYSNDEPKSFYEGESLPGQVAKDKKIINVGNIPDNYLTVVSGLGNSNPRNLIIIPILEKEETVAIIELATFKKFDKDFEKIFEKMSLLIGKIIVKIKE